MSTIADRVAAGVAFLDQADPDWWRAGVDRAIDLEALDLPDSAMCVLGQRCPLETLADWMDEDPGDLEALDEDERYYAYGYALMRAEGDPRPLRIWAHEHGFGNDPAVHPGGWDDLTAEWRRVITGRRSA